MDFEAARIKMVDNQIRTTDVTSHPVLSAFLTVPREAFVPEEVKALAYIDTDVKVSSADGGRYVMEPSPLAKLVQLAAVQPGDAVLEIGSNSGYGAAILSRIAQSVVAVESDAALAAKAKATLSALGYGNVTVVEGPLEAGHAAKAPYDVIFLHGAVETVPDAVFNQLKDGGRLVAVVGYGNASRAKLFIREGGIVSDSPSFNTAVKPLPGFRLAREFVF
ncbi:protein-L-isoaspartate O-methyltransferase [Xaviernesmea oryzae]|uniref:Protein-L-isoaspartate O-methyltransferase n=1 Tax=Xaviernesmea oryzae TaxID=464029 RepID=A0A1Q9AX32_9HYPH|nr:protein-L-isoaspartate O-methyltransferase [Xaviernesmea oryzae]OLP60007.1 protein-L-isoaspartate O-methyltransferase [Xaviernesmea oryzae]SEK40469.1 protein-L-isoaspartate(D-aspartate) O-methyltransferase [Xaviernesmea oryzae]